VAANVSTTIQTFFRTVSKRTAVKRNDHFPAVTHPSATSVPNDGSGQMGITIINCSKYVRYVNKSR